MPWSVTQYRVHRDGLRAEFAVTREYIDMFQMDSFLY